MITPTIATQAAGRARPALPARRSTTSAYELERMGDHAASVAKQARKLAPYPPLERYVDLPEMGELRRPRWCAGHPARLVDVDAAQARAVAARDDEVDDLYHRIFDEVVDLMRADPATSSAGRGSCSRRTTSSGSATG